MTYPEVRLHVAGEWRGARSGETLPIMNPATGEEIGVKVTENSPLQTQNADEQYNFVLDAIEKVCLNSPQSFQPAKD